MDFVALSAFIPGIVLEMRYAGAYNFVGERIDGYDAPCALLTREAAQALRQASEAAGRLGYCFKVFDAYRPQCAVDHFVRWAQDEEDTRMKAVFYPEVEKRDLFRLGYIAQKSGHSRGSAVDLTLFDPRAQADVDMGGAFDYFGARSHAERTEGLTDAQRVNRALLRQLMLSAGFAPLSTEWWHFKLKNEPYPDTYFTDTVLEMRKKSQP